MSAAEAWRIGEAPRRAGVTPHALRHYEALGLLRPRRSPSGQRLYGEEDIARVRFVRRAAAVGFTLAEIGEILRLRDGGQAPCGWVRARLGEKVAALEARIAELMRLRAELLALRDGPAAEGAPAACCPVLERGGARATVWLPARRGPRAGCRRLRDSVLAAAEGTPLNRPPTSGAARRPLPPR